MENYQVDLINLAKQVEERYKRYLETTFYFKDPDLRKSFQEALDVLNEAIDAYRWKSIVIPPLGCGLGGLDYKDVKFFITAKLKKHIESKFTTLYLVDDK